VHWPGIGVGRIPPIGLGDAVGHGEGAGGGGRMPPPPPPPPPLPPEDTGLGEGCGAGLGAGDGDGEGFTDGPAAPSPPDEIPCTAASIAESLPSKPSAQMPTFETPNWSAARAFIDSDAGLSK
jgi:hypothetical protein